MSAKTGVGILVRIGNTRRTVTLANGSAGETFTLSFEGEETAAIPYDAAAGDVETALEALDAIEEGDVTVAGDAGGPYTVAFQGRYLGHEVSLEAGEATGDLEVTLTDPGPTYTTVAGQRGATLNRGTSTADATSKDTPGWEENLPVLSNWSVEMDALLITDDAGYLALQRAHRYRRRVNVVIEDGALTESGVGTITDFPQEAPHDDVATVSATIQGTGALAEA